MSTPTPSGPSEKEEGNITYSEPEYRAESAAPAATAAPTSDARREGFMDRSWSPTRGLVIAASAFLLGIILTSVVWGCTNGWNHRNDRDDRRFDRDDRNGMLHRGGPGYSAPGYGDSSSRHPYDPRNGSLAPTTPTTGTPTTSTTMATRVQ